MIFVLASSRTPLVRSSRFKSLDWRLIFLRAIAAGALLLELFAFTGCESTDSAPLAAQKPATKSAPPTKEPKAEASAPVIEKTAHYPALVTVKPPLQPIKLATLLPSEAKPKTTQSTVPLSDTKIVPPNVPATTAGPTAPTHVGSTRQEVPDHQITQQASLQPTGFSAFWVWIGGFVIAAALFLRAKANADSRIKNVKTIDIKISKADESEVAQVAPPDSLPTTAPPLPTVPPDIELTTLSNTGGSPSKVSITPPPTPRNRSPATEAISKPTIPPDEPIAVRNAVQEGPKSYEIPKPKAAANWAEPPGSRAARLSAQWYPKNEKVEINGFSILGGLIYVGRNLPAVHRQGVEPAMINPSLPINASAANCRERMLNYWSSYSDATPAARASYLQWLSSGRSDPEADVGYVFLFFYGLERRILFDTARETVAAAEIDLVIAEVERLRTIYAKSRSFDRYSNQFLQLVASLCTSGQEISDVDELPSLTRYDIPLELRKKLGWYAKNKMPLPANWAYAWHYCDPRTRLLAAGERCPEHYRTLFEYVYLRRYGDGLILPLNKTQLKVTYRPASASFGEIFVQSIDLPDIALMTAAYGKLEEVAAECFTRLDPHSRYVGRNRDGANSLDAKLLLPIELWPEAWQTSLQAGLTRAHSAEPDDGLAFRNAFQSYGFIEDASRAQYQALVRGCEEYGLGVEPDLRFTKEIPGLDDPVSIFAAPAPHAEDFGPAYSLSALILQLAAVVASADGDFSMAEANRLQEEIERDAKLTPPQKRRLRARLACYRKKAPGMTGLRSLIDPLDRDSRLKIADVMIATACADGVIEPREIRAMERIYTLLGLDTAALYPRLNTLSSESVSPVTAGSVAKTGMKLDRAKIERTKAASEEVSRKLAAIFIDESASVGPPPPPEPATNPGKPPILTGLDAAHSELLEVVLDRAQWTRAEFLELCAARGLMADGAIERINEASYNQFDEALIDGEDPIEVALHLLLATSS